jgi:glutaredoxin
MNGRGMNIILRRIAPLALLVAAGWLGVQLIQSFGSERIGREMASNAKPGDIVMLSSETCENCKHARAWFKEHRVAFGECFIERDAACRAAFDALQSPGTPTLVVRGQRQIGFSPERVAQTLRQG